MQLKHIILKHFLAVFLLVFIAIGLTSMMMPHQDLCWFLYTVIVPSGILSGLLAVSFHLTQLMTENEERKKFFITLTFYFGMAAVFLMLTWLVMGLPVENMNQSECSLYRNNEWI